jgi:hypothetical protein
MDFIAVEALVSDLLPRAEYTDCRKVLHGETGGLRCCGEATLAEALPRTTLRLHVNSSAGEQQPNVVSPSRQPSAAVPRLSNAIQLAFFDDSLVRFIGIFNPILIIIAFGWQELLNLIKAVRAAATGRSGHKAHRLTDFEFKPVQRQPLPRRAATSPTAAIVGLRILGALARAATNSPETSFLACVVAAVACNPIEFGPNLLEIEASPSHFAGVISRQTSSANVRPCAVDRACRGDAYISHKRRTAITAASHASQAAIDIRMGASVKIGVAFQ